MMRAFLRAIQQNNSIEEVQFYQVTISGEDTGTFLDTSASLKRFAMAACDLAPENREHGIGRLVESLQRNETIEKLRLSNLDNLCLVPILRGLVSNSCLRVLTIGPAVSSAQQQALSEAIQSLLEGTTSIRRFELGWWTMDGEAFRPLAEKITRSSVSELNFYECDFTDQHARLLFENMLQTKQNLRSLSLSSNRFDGVARLDGALIATLQRAGSCLCCLELWHVNMSMLFPGTSFRSFLRAIVNSKLERFSIGCVEIHCSEALLSSIPSLKVKELGIQVQRNPRLEGDEMVQAVMQNFFLQSVKVERYGENAIVEDCREQLKFCTDRNVRLAQWIDNPASVPRSLWPEALQLARKAGYDTLYSSLRQVLESDFVSPQRGRKRKRPHYYAPS